LSPPPPLLHNITQRIIVATKPWSVFVWNMVHQRGYQGVRIKIKSLIAAIETES
jgi:hypothetical protein